MTLHQYMAGTPVALPNWSESYRDGYSAAIAWYDGESGDRDPPDWADADEWTAGWIAYEMEG